MRAPGSATRVERRSTPPRLARAARRSRSSSATSRATPRPASGWIPRRSGSSSPATSTKRAPRSSGTARASRSSSATPSWRSSESRRSTRTTPCAPPARRSSCRHAVSALGLQARIGINTGEVVSGSGDALVTGDAVNVAARLEQAAEPGVILIGDVTHRLLSDAVTSELAGPVTAKGKAEPLDAWRLRRRTRRRRGGHAEAGLADRRPRARAGASAAGLRPRAATSGHATCSRFSALPASGSRGCVAELVGELEADSARRQRDAASRTARGSPSGRSSKCWTSSATERRNDVRSLLQRVPPRRRSCSSPPAGCSKPSHGSSRSSSSSTTCTGPSRPSST